MPTAADELMRESADWRDLDVILDGTCLRQKTRRVLAALREAYATVLLRRCRSHIHRQPGDPSARAHVGKGVSRHRDRQGNG